MPSWRRLLVPLGQFFIYESKQKQQTGILSLNNVLMVAPDVMIGAEFLDSLYLDWFPTWLCIGFVESHCLLNPNRGSHGFAAPQGNESRHGECSL